tara:strand:+ start:959 stop:1714 length:756 start_codon:yes stop_codon:yes gene_type:complete
MTHIEIKRKDLLDFLLSVGKDIPDLVIACAGVRVSAEIAYASYYLRKAITCTNIVKEGTFYISDLDKVVKFLKASKQDEVTVRQTSPTKPIHFVAGANKLQLPSTDDIESNNKVPIVRKMMAECSAGKYTKIGKHDLIAHVTVNDTKDLKSLAGMRSLISGNSLYRLRVHCGENELGIVAGTAKSGRLFTSLPISESDGPNATVESNFGEWLPKQLQYLDDGSVRVYMGDHAPVIFSQPNTLILLTNILED